MKARTRDELIGMIKKHNTRSSFNEEYGTGVLRAIKRNGLLEMYETQMPMQLKSVGYWTDEKVCELAMTYTSRTLFRSENKGAYSAIAKRKKLYLLDMILPSQKLQWTKELVLEEALKYSMSRGFIEKSSGAYNYSIKHNFYHEIQNSFSGGNTSWTYEALKLEALKYKTIGEFRIASSAYDTILARGLLRDLCSHLEYSHQGGFNPSKAATLYYLRVCGGEAYKIGITNRSVGERYKLSDIENIKVIKEWDYPIGHDALDMETRILSEYKYAKYVGSDILTSGNSELFDRDILGLDIEP